MDHKHNGELPMKRQRGRGRKPGGGGGNYHHSNQGGGGGHHHPNRALESNGPETKVRGPASHINERYLQLARDAASAGDRVLSENYLQHADHYFRLWRSMQPAAPIQQQQQNFNDSGDYEGDDEGGPEGEGADETEARGGDEQPDAEYQGDRQREGGERTDGDRGPRRGRGRRRFRPEGEREGGGFEAREGGEERGEPRRSEGGEPPREQREPRESREPREAREPREPRRERAEGEAREPQPREDRDSGSREGFSDGPKPAFLRGGGGSGE
jgi:hypothetical protein